MRKPISIKFVIIIFLIILLLVGGIVMYFSKIKRCKNSCSNRGQCDTKTGLCTCNSGLTGDDCSRCKNKNYDPNNNCNTCLKNYDPSTNCSTCINTLYDPSTNCSTCKNTLYDPSTNCSTCLDKNYDPRDCKVCKNTLYDISTNCSACLDKNYDPSDCKICKNTLYDPSSPSDCKICKNTLYDPSNNCTVCKNTLYDPSNNCTVCKNTLYDPSNNCTVCKNTLYDPSSPSDCKICKNTLYDPSNNCTVCKNTLYDPLSPSDCKVCKNTLYDPLSPSDCRVCLKNLYDPSSPSDCKTCLNKNYDPSNNCTVCIKKCGQDDGTGKNCINTYFTDNVGDWTITYYYNDDLRTVLNCKVSKYSDIYYNITGTNNFGTISIVFDITDQKNKITLNRADTDTLGMGINNGDEYRFDKKTNSYIYIDPEDPKSYPTKIFPTMCSMCKNALYDPSDCTKCLNKNYDPSSPSDCTKCLNKNYDPSNNCTVCIKKCGQDDGTGKNCINTLIPDNINKTIWSISYYLNGSIQQVDKFEFDYNSQLQSYSMVNNQGPNNLFSALITFASQNFTVNGIFMDKFYTGIQNNDIFTFNPKNNYYTCNRDTNIKIFPTVCKI